MKHSQLLQNELQNQNYRDLFMDIYLDATQISYQTIRYMQAIQNFEKAFGCGDIEIYSAPGRSEIGGNHTDHQHGEVLAASINNDAIGIVQKIEEPIVKLISDQYHLITIDLSDLKKREKEEGTTAALIRGVLAGMEQRGYHLGGFSAYITSDVLIGAGLSSSAAFETLLGTILSGLYNEQSISSIEIAQIGQYAENRYFGKPCGLMDQMACSIGNLVHINFANPKEPIVNQIACDLNQFEYSLCITDTKGSHADLTSDYAAIPQEMKQVAACFGKAVLSEINKKELLTNLPQIRKKVGDRAILRAIHFIEENQRVQEEVFALQQGNFAEFLSYVKASGSSSFQYLQNVYANHEIEQQNLSLALAVSESLLGNNGVCRVHGGGFAGTIQAFVKNTAVPEYKQAMDSLFGKDSCNLLKIRKYGGRKVI